MIAVSERWGATPRLLLIGQAGAPSGFARVMQALALRLARHFEVHLLNTLPAGSNAVQEPCAFYTLHASLDEERSPEALLAFCQELRPDVCLMLDETRACASQADTLRKLPHRPPVLCYCATDEPEQLIPEVLPALAAADSLIAFTHQAMLYFEGAFAAAGITPPPLSAIPHGVDRAVFQPMDRREARCTFFGTDPSLQDEFIVLNANRNQPFKRVDLTLQGFALFAQGKPATVKLYLHMGSRPPVPGAVPLVDQLGIRDRLLTPATYSADQPYLSLEQLNLLYNCCDVGINTSDREGWGLVSLEHAATGVPQVVPDLPTLQELWRGAALVLPTQLRVSAQVLGRLALCTRPEEVAEALERLYQDPAARAFWGEAALARAQRPAYQWDTIAEQWSHVLWTALDRRARTRGA